MKWWICYPAGLADGVNLRVVVCGRQSHIVSCGVCDFNDWEVEVVVEFFQLLNSNIVTNAVSDGLRWKLCKDSIHLR